MRFMKAFCIVLGCALAACGRSPGTPPAATQSTVASTQRSEPPNADFIGRVWIAADRGTPYGSMLIFLPDRSLLMDSCFETYRIVQWGVADDKIRWLEETVPIEAEVTMPGKDELVLRIAGRDRTQTYIAATVPYTCPDMPR